MTCRVLRIGVFFDGTGNNKANDVAGRSENGLSNIAKLSELYPHNHDEEPPENAPAHICKLHTQMIISRAWVPSINTTIIQLD